MRCKSWIFYLTIPFWLLVSCAGPEKLVLPPEFSNNCKSGKIDLRILKDKLVRVYNYRAFKDSLISLIKKDTTLTLGIILPHTFTAHYWIKREMIFGTDTEKCTIRYNYYNAEYHEEQSSLSYIWGGKTEEPKITSYYTMVTGTIEYPALEKAVEFRFEKPGEPKSTNGYLFTGRDSFLVKPIIYSSKNPQSYLKTGLKLIKNDTLYAVLEYTDEQFMNFSTRGKLSLYTKATPSEQMIVVAYLTIVDWSL